MTTKLIKIGSGVASAALIVTGFANGVFAQDAAIDTNGANSDNRINISSTDNTTVDQTNTNTPTVTLSVTSNTGNNRANDNTGGGMDLGTGNSNSTMNVTVGGSVNDATIDCGCDPNGTTTGLVITHNGSGSTNRIRDDRTHRLDSTQTNVNDPFVSGTVDSNTGRNRANRNTNDTGDTSALQSGDSNTTLNVTVRGSRNRLNRTTTPTPTDLGL